MRRLNENDKSSVCLKLLLLLLLANHHRFSNIKITHAYTYTFSIIINHFDMNDNTLLTKRFQNRFEPYALLTRLIDIIGRLRDFHWPPFIWRSAPLVLCVCVCERFFFIFNKALAPLTLIPLFFSLHTGPTQRFYPLLYVKCGYVMCVCVCPPVAKCNGTNSNWKSGAFEWQNLLISSCLAMPDCF